MKHIFMIGSKGIPANYGDLKCIFVYQDKILNKGKQLS